MKKILFIHQSAELYGSDKTLLLLLQHINRVKFFPVVILPSDGPLKQKLEALNIVVEITPVLKLHRKMFSPKNMLQFFSQIKSGIKMLDALHDRYHFDMVYSNTVAVLLGIIYASSRKLKHVWHVHEIIESPVVVKKIFRKLLALKANSKVVYNSGATQHFWNSSNKISKKSIAIPNGQELNDTYFSDEEKESVRKDLLLSNEEVIIALVGRISRGKGHWILLEAYNSLAKKYPNIKLVFVGSTPPNQELLLQKLEEKILEYDLGSRVGIIPFQDDISKIWKSIDIAVVPSIGTEAFGLVALEAMLAKKAVIASDLGGLSEIVVHNNTGFLVRPNDSAALIVALEELIVNLELRNDFGTNGYNRAREVFSAEKYVACFEKLFAEML